MKILHVSHGGLGKGGVSTVILSIVSQLYKDYDFGCVVYTKHLPREEEFIQYGGVLHRINTYSYKNPITKFLDVAFRPLILIFGIYKICKKGRYDVIHCHNGWEAAFCLIGAKLAGVKKRVGHVHNPLLKSKSFFRNAFLSCTYRIVDILSTQRVGCSKEACISSFKGDYLIIYNSIDFSKFSWSREKDDKIIRFIHVGRFSYVKNQEFIIDIFSEMLSARKDIRLLLVGFGEDKYKLQSKINKLSLGDYISLVDGTTCDIPNIFSNSDYMIFPSRFEGFGIVLLEAQASGVYCFVSDVVPDITNSGFCEKLSLKDDAISWARQILYRIDHAPTITKELVYCYLRQFSIDSIAIKYKELYDEK